MPRGESYNDVHVDRPLTNFSVAYWQSTDMFVSQNFFNTVPVNYASDVYTVYPQGYFHRLHNTKRPEDGVANTVNYGTNEERYSVQEDALRIFISDKKRSNADSQRNLDLEASQTVLESVLLGKENDFVTNFLSASKWSVDRAGVATGDPTGTQFRRWDRDDADPVQDILDQIVDMTRRSAGRRPNKMLMTLDVYMKVREHASILDRVRYAQGNNAPAQINLAALAALFEVDEIQLMQTVYNSADDGIEDADGNPPSNNAYLKDKTVLLAHVAPGVGLFTPTAGQTFVWNQYISHGVNAGPAIRRYRPQDGRKGEFIEAELAVDQKLVSADLGALFSDVIS